MAHAPLVRTQTAPVFQAGAPGPGGPPRMNSTMSVGGPSRSSQLSGSTAFKSTTSLNSLATGSTLVNTPPINGQVVATGNIINQAADASRSLYQICVALKARLRQVPGFEPHLQELEMLENNQNLDGICEALWQLFRTGYPMLTIYNALQPDPPLIVKPEEVDKLSADNIGKKATFKFIKACLQDLNMGSQQVFGIGDLYKSDTTGFVKVTNVVNAVLDQAEQRGLLHPAESLEEESEPNSGGTKKTPTEYIIGELVDTERKYVQDLENFYDLKKALEYSGAIPTDVLVQIFGNIDSLLDHQRRFLIKVETTNSQPGRAQFWGDPFVRFEDHFISIYQLFIANQRKASKVAESVFDKIQATGHPVACDFKTLDGFINKPMQRLTKYPLLLRDLHKKREEENLKEDLSAGIASSLQVLEKANDAVDRELLDEALEELKMRVDDWKNHRVDQFGRLLLHGVYTVLTGKNDQMKPYEIYLFECILLCCKDLIPGGKTKDKKDKKLSTNAKINKPKSDKLQLKGRIFMTNVTEVLTLAKPGKDREPGSYMVQIFWKGDPGVESFNIKFQNEETMRRWANALDLQRKANAVQSTTSPSQNSTEFTWMRDRQTDMPNPYAEQDDDDDDDDETVRSGMTNSQYGMQQMPGRMPRNASSSSLRGRSATGDSTGSLAGMVRAPPPRFPLPAPPPLNLQTQQGAGSPGPRGGDSYFSPVSESPVSSRTSGTSGMFSGGAYPFPGSRNGTPQPGWDGEHNRYTAPAMPRAPSRDGTVPNNAYGMVNGRNPRGPSMPVMSQNQSLTQQNRSRSYSTPDIQGQPARRTPGGSQGNIPAVPGIPAHLHASHERHDSSIPRSSAGSPNHLRNELPMRANTQSPGVQRERLQQQQNYGGAMGQFPAQPIYPRQNAAGPTPLSLGNETGRTVSPPLGTGAIMSPDMPLPTQLKVKVNYDKSNYITLVVAYNITYQSLIDRIDAKLARSTTSSIAKGNLKLRYQDEDGDFVSIESDDDIQIAFMEWRDGMRDMYNGGVGEIELFCVGELFN